MSALLQCPGVLAIERTDPGAPDAFVADRDRSRRIAQDLADDLVRIDPASDFSQFDLIVAGALFDQVQVLRPQWPAHHALLHARSRLLAQTDAAILAIGAHAGRMPDPVLQPDQTLFGSPMLFLPFLLYGAEAAMCPLIARFERDLLDRGQAGAALALAVQEAFAIRVAHAQIITTIDLCAIACAQYQHAGMGELWNVIETALLRPDDEYECIPGPGTHVTYRNHAIELSGENHELLEICRAVFAAHAIPLAED